MPGVRTLFVVGGMTAAVLVMLVGPASGAPVANATASLTFVSIVEDWYAVEDHCIFRASGSASASVGSLDTVYSISYQLDAATQRANEPFNNIVYANHAERQGLIGPDSVGDSFGPVDVKVYLGGTAAVEGRSMAESLATIPDSGFDEAHEPCQSSGELISCLLDITSAPLACVPPI